MRSSLRRVEDLSEGKTEQSLPIYLTACCSVLIQSSALPFKNDWSDQKTLVNIYVPFASLLGSFTYSSKESEYK